MPSEAVYVTDSIVPLGGSYHRRLRAQRKADRHHEARLIPFGIRHSEAATYYLDWDCADEQLPAGANRVWIGDVTKHQWGDSFDFSNSNAPAILKELSHVSGCMWRSYQDGDSEIVFSESTILEPMVAPSEAVARLLLSPFSEGFIRIAIMARELVIELNAKEFGFPSSTQYSFALDRDEALCLAYWLNPRRAPVRLASLRLMRAPSAAAASERRLSATGATAVRIGQSFYVQSFGDRRVDFALDSFALVTVIDSASSRGMSWLASRSNFPYGASRAIPLSRHEVAVLRDACCWQTLNVLPPGLGL